MKQYRGDVKITKANAEEWAKKLKDVEVIIGGLQIYQGASLTAAALTEVGGLQIDQGASLTAAALVKVTGGLHIYQGASLTAAALTEVGGLHIDATLPAEIEKLLWEVGQGKRWTMGDNASDWMLSQQGNITYMINDVQFDKGLFHKVRKGELTAAEVFALPNMEQRRVAYEKMDKTKMKELPDFTVLDQVANDGCGYAMQIVSFKLPNFSKPFLFLNCFCPSGGREYYLETQQKTCWAAKAASFGLPAGVKWVAEY